MIVLVERGSRGACALVVFVAAAPACSLTFDYGIDGEEVGAFACTDGLDNDFDGRPDCADPSCDEVCREDTDVRCADGVDNDLDQFVDCLDPGCDGRCPERGGRACADGRDNDGDGAADVGDLACWRVLGGEAAACGSLLGTDLRSTIQALGSEWVGRAVLRTDVRGLEGELVAAGPDGSTHAFLVSGAPLVGGLDFRVGALVAAGNAAVSLTVYRDDDLVITEEAPPASLGLALSADRTRAETVVRLDAGTEIRSALPLSRTPGGRVTLQITRGNAGSLELHVADDLDLIGTARLAEFSPFATVDAPLRVRWDARGDAATSALLAVVQSRAPFDPCGYQVPQLPEADVERGLAAAADDAGGLCVVLPDARATDVVQAYNFATLEAYTRRELTLDGAVSGLALAWDAVGARWLLLAALGVEGGPPVSPRLLASADCRDWQPLDAAFDGDLPIQSPVALGLALDAAVWSVVWVTRSRGQTLVQRWDAAPSSAPVFEPRLRVERADRWPSRLGPVVRAGDGWAAVGPAVEGLEVWVGPLEAFEPADLVLLLPSRRVSAFDAQTLLRGALALERAPSAEDGRWHGTLVYAAGRGTACPTCAAAGAVPLAFGGEGLTP